MKKFDGLQLSFYLLKNRAENGYAPMMCRIQAQGDKISKKLDVSVCVKQWHQKEQIYETRAKNYKEVRTTMDEMQRHFNEVVKRLQIAGIPEIIENYRMYDKDEVVKVKKETLMEMFDFHSEFSEHILSDATKSSYMTARTSVLIFLKMKYKRDDIYLNEITLDFAHSFYNFMVNNEIKEIGYDNGKKRKKRPCGAEGALMTVKKIEVILRLAVKHEFLLRDPFANFSVPHKRNQRGWLESEEIKKLMALTIKKGSQKNLARDMFLFCAFTGTAYIDMCKLTKDNIVVGIDGNTWLKYKRQKTHVEAFVPLTEIPKNIIAKYEDSYKEDVTKLIPCIAISKYDYWLNLLGKEIGASIKLGSHIARHSFAVAALENGIPIETVSKFLGHTDIKTTQIYAKVTFDKVRKESGNLMNAFDRMNREVMTEKNNPTVARELGVTEKRSFRVETGGECSNRVVINLSAAEMKSGAPMRLVTVVDGKEVEINLRLEVGHQGFKNEESFGEKTGERLMKIG